MFQSGTTIGTKTEEEKEEFAIAGAFEEAKNLKDLGRSTARWEDEGVLLGCKQGTENQKKPPSGHKVKRENENGESEIFEERGLS
jgi:hypothetical protein